MSHRNREPLLVEVIAGFEELPFWMAPVGAVGAYLFLTLGVQTIVGQSVPYGALSRAGAMLAPWFAGAILLFGLRGAVILAFSRRRDGTILTRQKSIETIRSTSWRDFERMMAAHYRTLGFSVEATPSGADGGVDLILKRDGNTTYVQCKQWRMRDVGVRPVRELHGVAAAGGVDSTIFVCTGKYTPEARNFARTVGMELVDGPALLSMISFRGSDRALAGPSQTAACPRCGKSMVRRTARRGPDAGRDFLGCSTFPVCRATLPLHAA